jgi:hypothetical protein
VLFGGDARLVWAHVKPAMLEAIDRAGLRPEFELHASIGQAVQAALMRVYKQHQFDVVNRDHEAKSRREDVKVTSSSSITSSSSQLSSPSSTTANHSSYSAARHVDILSDLLSPPQ